MPKRNEVAAKFHRWMCEDSRFGYTQGGGRWGSGALEYWTHDGVTGQFQIGDRDCSSSVIDCWQEALRGSAYEGALSGATYTGNMRSVFVNSGLFEWKPMSFIAQTGDIYLNESDHTAMCQSAVPDILSEFLINEHGTITGGSIGDQTGWESVVRGYYNFPWNGILHYNGKADDDMEAHDVWEYNYKNTAPRGNMYNCMLGIYDQLTRTDNAGWNSPKGHDIFGRVNAMQVDLAQIKKDVANIKTGGATVDYDKLANKVADVIYARMKA